MTLPEKRHLTKRDENNVVKRVCRHCRRQFNSGRALGGHLRIHKDQKKTTFTRKKARSKITTNTTNNEIVTINVDVRNSLTLGWKLRGKRGSKSVNDDDDDDDNDDGDHYLNGGNVYDGDDVHGDEDCEDEEEDVDEDGFHVMQTLRNYGFRDNAHRITKTRSVFICKTCDMRFPTFHAVLVHVNDHADSSSATIDGENIMGIHFEPTIDDAAATVDGKAISAADLEATSDDVVIDDQKEVEEEMNEEEDLEIGGDGPTHLNNMSDETSYEVVQVVEDEEDFMKVADKETEGGGANKEENGGIVAAVVEDGVKVTEEEKVVTQVEDDQVGVDVDNEIVDQNVSTSKPKKMLGFDLNELPPNED